jgi:peptidoglycan/LPS O-acetylase OafA/YrhL
MAETGPRVQQAGFELAGRGARITELDGLRGFAVALIVAQHAFTRPYLPLWSAILGRPVASVLDMAWCGVDIFFVLSGYLIGGIILEHRSSDRFYPAFYARRTARIFPSYFLLIALAYLPFDGRGHNAGEVPLLGYVTFTSNLYTSMGTAFSDWLRPLWSVSIEEQFYLLAPICLRVLPLRLLPWMLGAVIIGSAGVRTATLIELIEFGPSVWEFTLTRIDGLAIGVLGAFWMQKPAVLPAALRRASTLGVAFALLLAGCWWFAQQSAEMQVGPGILWFSITALVAIVLVRLHPGSWLGRILCSRYLVFLGRYSYFIYLFNMPVLWLAAVYTPAYFGAPATAQLAVNALAMIALCAIAPRSWRYFEAPLLALGRRVRYGRGQDAPATVANPAAAV